LWETAFREWGKNPVLNNPRQRTHTPDGVRVSIHHGAAPFLGMTGYMSHCELLKQFPEHQKSVYHGHPMTILYDASTAELRAILVGNPTSTELPISHAATELRTAAARRWGLTRWREGIREHWVYLEQAIRHGRTWSRCPNSIGFEKLKSIREVPKTVKRLRGT